MGATRHNLARLQNAKRLRRLIKVQLTLLDQVRWLGRIGGQGRIKDQDFIAE